MLCSVHNAIYGLLIIMILFLFMFSANSEWWDELHKEEDERIAE